MDWEVTGTSSIEITSDELAKLGWTENTVENLGAVEAFKQLNEFYKGDLTSELVDEFDERDAPEIISVDVSGEDGFYL